MIKSATGMFQPSILYGARRFESILATHKVDMSGDSRDSVISAGLIQQVNVGPGAKRKRVEHISHRFANCSGGTVDMAGPGQTMPIVPANLCGGE